MVFHLKASRAAVGAPRPFDSPVGVVTGDRCERTVVVGWTDARQTGFVPDLVYHHVGEAMLAVREWSCSDPIHPGVVLLPGTGSTADDWDHIAADLCLDRNVYAVDLRGHGNSDWPGVYSIDAMSQDVAALLKGLDTPVDMVGHSLGGLIGCRVATGSTPRVRRLVLEDVGVLHWRPGVQQARPPGELRFDWAVVEQVRPEIDTPDSRWRSVLSAIAIPVLAIGGGPESFVPQDHIDELVATVTDGRKVTIDAGHEIHTARPTEFLAHLRAFLDTGEAAAPEQDA